MLSLTWVNFLPRQFLVSGVWFQTGGSDWLDQVQVLQVQQALMFLEKLSDFLQTLLPVLNFCVLT